MTVSNSEVSGECSPLLSGNQAISNNNGNGSIQTANNGSVSSLVVNDGSAADDRTSKKEKNNPISDDSTGSGSQKRGAYSDVVPTWSEMMHHLLPFLRPLDVKHMSLAVLALVSVMGGKILNVLPPLAIKYAVDVLTQYANTSKGAEPSGNISDHAGVTTSDVQTDNTITLSYGTNSASGTATTSSIMNNLASSSPERQILVAILVYFGLKLVTLLNATVQDLAQRMVALDAERRFGVATFGHLHTLSLSYHLEKHIGEVTRIMNRGVDAISTVISSFLFYLIPTLFEALIVSAVFWKLGTPTIALSTVVAVVFYLWFTVAVTKTRVAYRRQLIEASDAVGQKETETLVNYETVSMFGRTKHEIELYGVLRETYKTRRVSMLSMFALLELGQKFIRLCGVAAGLLLAGSAALHQPEFTAGSFVVIQMYIDQLFQPLTMLGWQYRMITQAFTDLEKAVTMQLRVPDVQDEANAMTWTPLPSVTNSNIDDTPDKTTSKTTSGNIVFQNVTFRYKVDGGRDTALGGNTKGAEALKGGRRGRMRFMDDSAPKKKKTKGNNENSTEGDDEEKPPVKKVQLGGVTNVDFTVPAGKTTALVGSSGSGKTTLVRLVLRMYDTDTGAVLVDGHDVRHLTQESLRQHIGVVAQDTILFNASLRDNIVYGKQDATLEEIWAAVRAAALEEFVKGLPQQLDTMVGERGMKLSGGERQRVGLARCIIKDPTIILLDEATSALDSSTEREIQRNIKIICQNRTTIMIAHRLSTARNADEIVVLQKGEIVERGTHAELLDIPNGQYARMWHIQTTGDDEMAKVDPVIG